MSIVQKRDTGEFVLTDNYAINQVSLKKREEEHTHRAPAGNLILYSALSMLLSMVFRKMTENQNTRLAINDHLLSYIKRNCCSRLLINEIAAKCGYTTEHFSRIFRAYTGKSPLAYINECRISYAKELLLNTDKPIEICCNNSFRKFQ